MSLKNHAKRTELLDKLGWRLIGWDCDVDEKKRKNVTVECIRDKLSFKHLPYHGALSLWRSMLNHKDCEHGREALKPPKKCATCGQPLPETQPGDGSET